MANKIKFTLIDEGKEILNGDIQLWEVYKVPQWLAKKANYLLENSTPETFIAEVTSDTITFCYATDYKSLFEEGKEEADVIWHNLLYGAWDMFFGALDPHYHYNLYERVTFYKSVKGVLKPYDNNFTPIHENLNYK